MVSQQKWQISNCGISAGRRGRLLLLSFTPLCLASIATLPLLPPFLYRHLAILPCLYCHLATLPPCTPATLPPCLYCHLDILPPCHLAILPKNNLFSRGFAIIQRLPMLKVGVHSGNHFQNCELLKSNPKLLLKTYKC